MTNNTPLDQKPEDNTPLDGESVQEVHARPQNNEDIYMATGQDDLELPQAKAQFVQGNMRTTQRIIDEAFGVAAPAETVRQALVNQNQKVVEFQENPDFYLEQALALRDPDTSADDVRFAINDRIGSEMMEELKADEVRAAGMNQVADAVIDFGAMILREGTIGIYESLTDRTERRGTELLWHKLNDTPSEFKTFFEGWIEDARKEGLNNNNAWAISQLEEEFFSNGVDHNKNLKKAFALLDAMGIGSLAKAPLKMSLGLAKSSTRGGRMAVVEGVEASADKAAAVTSRAIDPELKADASLGTLNPHKQPVSPSEGWYTRAIHKIDLLKRLEEGRLAGAAGKIADEAELNRVALKASDNFAARVGSPIVDTQLNALELGRYQVEMTFGTSKGGTYVSEKTAQPLANKVGGTPELANPADPDSGWVVKVRQNLATKGAISKIDWNEFAALEQDIVRSTLGKVFGNKFMGSAALRGVEDLTTSVQLGEGFSAFAKKEFMKEVKKIDAVGSKDLGYINSILGRLRDDPVEAAKRTWYTPEEFRQLYWAEAGKAPTPKVQEAYQAAVDISDTAAALKAVGIMDKYVNLGYKTLDLGDIRVPAKEYPAHKLAADDLVYDAEIGAVFRFSNLDEGYGAIHKLDKPQFDGVEYVVKPKGVAELSPEDVMGYNAGGPRLNPNANFFVTLGGKRLKALLTTFTEADARVAVDDIRNLRTKHVAGTLTDEDVAKWNRWNPEVNTVEELNEFMRLHKWQFDELSDIGYKDRYGSILDTEVGGDEASTGMQMHEYIENDMRRNDQVLPQFGGEKSFNVDPLTAIGQQFGSAASEFSFRNYTQQAQVGWVKTAMEKRPEWFANLNIAKDDHRNLFRNAQISGTDEFANRMREIHAIESRRMHLKSPAASHMQELGTKVQDFVFNTTGKAVRLDDPVEQVSNKMLTIAYQSAFGFLNSSQVVVQGSHAATIMLASPKHGSKGAMMALVTRAFSSESPEIIQEMAKRLSGNAGLKSDEIVEMMEYLRTSGRDIVDGDAIEMGTGVGYGISSFGGESYNPTKLQAAWRATKKRGKQGLDAGLIPFNMGERLSRRTGIFTAILEFKAKNPGVPLNSDMARKWITRREQDLTFHMTTSSRPLVQSGAMKVPTQWLSHSFRAMETIAVGRNFTKWERARMFAVLFPAYGLSGFGMANAASYIADKFGWEEDSVEFTALKWGVLDGLTDWLLPDTDGKQGTGLAPRLTPLGAVIETARKITEGSLLEAVGGPSAQIIGGGVDAFVSALGNAVAGRDVMLTEDLVKLLRQPSGVDSIAKAWGIFQNGEYRSKNGVTIPGEMNTTDGILTLLGLTTLKQSEWYQIKTQLFRSNRKFIQYRKEINREAEKAFAMLQDVDTKDRGIEMFDELHSKIALSGFSFTQQTQLRRSLYTLAEDQALVVMRDLMEMERTTDQQRIGKTLGVIK